MRVRSDIPSLAVLPFIEMIESRIKLKVKKYSKMFQWKKKKKCSTYCYLYNKVHWHPFTILGRDESKNSYKLGDMKSDPSVRLGMDFSEANFSAASSKTSGTQPVPLAELESSSATTVLLCSFLEKLNFPLVPWPQYSSSASIS